jgi:D-glycero-D-manno-heptose 1,7-bisphosphate phosphatase
MNKAIFIDKDRILIEDIPNNVDLKLVTLNEEVIESLKIFQDLGYFLIIITNQSGIAFGHFKSHALKKLAKRVEELLKYRGVYIDGFLYCPHHPEGNISKYSFDCECRKPKPGLLYKAAKTFNVDLTSSWVIGNTLNDIEAGNLAGCRTILINSGNEVLNEAIKPSYIVSNLKQAENILKA